MQVEGHAQKLSDEIPLEIRLAIIGDDKTGQPISDKVEEFVDHNWFLLIWA